MNILKSILVTVVITGLTGGLSLLILLIDSNNELNLNYLTHLWGLASILPNLLIYSLAILYIKRTYSTRIIDFNKKFQSKPFIIILLIGIAFSIFKMPFYVWKSIMNHFLNSGYEITQYSNPEFNGKLVYRFLSAVIIAPVFEEIIFRFYIFGGLLKKHSLIISIIISSILFGLIHASSPRNIIPATILGIISALIFYNTKQIKYSILFHFILNLIWFIMIIFTEQVGMVMDFIGLGYYYFGLIALSGLTCYMGIKQLTTANTLYI